MSLPVSSYEELLARVRSLTIETIQLHEEISLTLGNGSESKKKTTHWSFGNFYKKYDEISNINIKSLSMMQVRILFKKSYFHNIC